MASSMSLSQKHYLFQVNRHVQSSIMLLSTMDSTELDLNNALLSLSSITTSNPDDYEKDLRLAAELGRCLLEQNQDLQNYINVLQKQLDDKQNDMKLIHAKLASTREQLDAKCRQTEILDSANFDLEQQLTFERRENEKNRQYINELLDSNERIRKQYQDMEHEFETFRTKQYSTYFSSKQMNSSYQTPTYSTPLSNRRQRSNSHSLQTDSSSPISLNSSISTNLFDVSSTSIFKSHLSELKSRINILTLECASLNEQLQRSEQDKQNLIDRITQTERQYRDDFDAQQSELNYYRKLITKSNNNPTKIILSTVYSPPECDLSLYDEVLLENKTCKSFYQPTNYKDLFSRVYEKLKANINT